MLSLPLLLIGGLLVLAAVTYLLRTWDRAIALVAAALLGVTALALWFMDLSVPVQTLPLVGRSVGLLAPLERLGFAMQLQA
ncbi:MAG: hypothetical protein R2851_26670, partial [Caldilineaceae bacterium]